MKWAIETYELQLTEQLEPPSSKPTNAPLSKFVKPPKMTIKINQHLSQTDSIKPNIIVMMKGGFTAGLCFIMH